MTRITILDGGMGGEIKDRLEGAAGGLWSAKALLDAPQLVVDLHREYILAGAQIITTNTYSTVPSYLEKGGLAHRYVELAKFAGELARDAAATSGGEIKVAASIPPLSESYRPDLVLSPSVALPVYENLVTALSEYADLYICETMSSADEARNAALQALAFGMGKPVYISWTLQETPGAGLRSGESVEAAFRRVGDLDVAGYMFNCTHPEAIEDALRTLRSLTPKPLGCYANRLNEVPEGWTLDGAKQGGRRADLTEDAFVASTLRCVEAGARMVGGCCGVGPGYIASLSRAINERHSSLEND